MCWSCWYMWVLCYILGWPTRHLLARYQHSPRYVVHVWPICASTLSVVCIHQWYSNVHIHIRKRSHPRTNQTFTIVRTAIFCMIYMRIHAHATYCIECSYASFTRRARTDSRCGRSGTPRHLFYMYTHGGRCRNTYTHTCICMHLCTHNNTLADAYISNALTHILTHRLVEHKREHAR